MCVCVCPLTKFTLQVFKGSFIYRYTTQGCINEILVVVPLSYTRKKKTEAALESAGMAADSSVSVAGRQQSEQAVGGCSGPAGTSPH